MGMNSKLRFSIEGEEDRISNLPDNILSRILSALPTKYAVLTSVLSSSWRHQWRTIDQIDIDYRHFLRQKSQENPDEKDDLTHFSRFVFFILNVMRNCELRNVLKFRLSCPKPINMVWLRACVTFAVSRNVQELDLDIKIGFSYKLPCEFFSSKSLKVLKIKTDYVFEVPTLVDGYFPNLKVLHVHFNDPAVCFSEKLFRGCPQIEELLIEAKPNQAFGMCFKILAVLLRKLVIIVPVKLQSKFSYKFEVDAPNLETLYVRDDSMSCTFTGSFPCLERTTFDLGTATLRDYYYYDVIVCERLTEVSKTKFLSLSLETTTALLRVCFIPILPDFPNLTCLKVTIHDFIVRELLYRLLKASPKLQTLILQMVNEGEEGELRRAMNWSSSAREPSEMPVCLSRELKTVKICSFRGEFVERNVIKYFLEWSKVLCNMIVYSTEPSIRDKFSKRLLKLPRSSKNCRVLIL